MRGLITWPKPEDVARAIDALETKQRIPTESLALMSQWARTEPRVAESLCRYLASEWPHILPDQLNQKLLTQPWPAAMGVILEFACMYLQDPLMKKKLRHWTNLVMSEISPENQAQFFVGLRKIAGTEMQKDASMSLRPYKKWGYLSREILVKSFSKATQNRLYDPSLREAIFREFIRDRKRFTINDYLQAFHGQISRRQAERDLSQMKSIRAEGRTRARTYVLAPSIDRLARPDRKARGRLKSP